MNCGELENREWTKRDWGTHNVLSQSPLVRNEFCPGEPVHKGISIVLSLFRSHWLAVVYCLVLCIVSREPVHEDRTPKCLDSPERNRLPAIHCQPSPEAICLLPCELRFCVTSPLQAALRRAAPVGDHLLRQCRRYTRQFQEIWSFAEPVLL